MRVIAGEARGRRLKVPSTSRLRPTSDLIRGVIFDMLAAREADLSRVLDLYAGTGALGIEALSRGAQWCDFVEQNAAACATIRRNLALAGFAERAKVYHWSAAQALHRLPGEYTLVLADPPYRDEGALAVMNKLASSPLLLEQAIIVYEHAKELAPPPLLGRFRPSASRRHGSTCVSIYQLE